MGHITDSSRFYIVYVVWLAIETTIIFFLYPETKGKPSSRFQSFRRRGTGLTSMQGRLWKN